MCQGRGKWSDGGLIWKEDADDEIGHGSGLHGQRVAEDEAAGGDKDGGTAAEGEGMIGAGLDFAGARAEGDVSRADGERGGAELVGELDAEGVSAEADVDDVAVGGVGEGRIHGYGHG
jgi:hypothetical protein